EDPPGRGRYDPIGQADLGGALGFRPTAFRLAGQGLRGRDAATPGSRLGFRCGGHTATITRDGGLASTRGGEVTTMSAERAGSTRLPYSRAICSSGPRVTEPRREGAAAPRRGARRHRTPVAACGTPAQHDANSLENTMEEMAYAEDPVPPRVPDPPHRPDPPR